MIAIFCKGLVDSELFVMMVSYLCTPRIDFADFNFHLSTSSLNLDLHAHGCTIPPNLLLISNLQSNMYARLLFHSSSSHLSSIKYIGILSCAKCVTIFEYIQILYITVF